MIRSHIPSDEIDIPLKRSRFYRLFEIIPGFLSIITMALVVVLSLVNPFWAAIYVLAVVVLVFVRGLSTLVNSWLGFSIINKTCAIDWHQRLQDLEIGVSFHNDKKELGFAEHLDNIEKYHLPTSDFPRINSIYHLIIIAAYNETVDVIGPTVQSLINSSSDKKRFIVCLAYEERGGETMANTAKKLQDKYQGYFFDFLTAEHPRDLPGEIIGKGGNITFAGKQMSLYLKDKQINSDNVIVTTLDSDNRPHQMYFDSVAYEFITHSNRQHMTFQPVALFLNNIWDAPALIRVSSSGDSIWNTVLTVRRHKLRNFAAHSQPMKALELMNFWSVRTVVEDGHQYWRSYFFFKGDYDVSPIRIPIYQDAVLSDSYRKTLVDRFVQVRRWAYGASDVPYVANMIKQHFRELPKAESTFKLFDLLEGHVTWAIISPIILLGGWIPSIFGRSGDVVVQQLPATISIIQTIAIVGLVSTVLLFFRFLPPRPKRYKKRRILWMMLQWATFPVASILYGSLAAFYSQFRLMTGRYLTKFDVTDKNTVIKD